MLTLSVLTQYGLFSGLSEAGKVREPFMGEEFSTAEAPTLNIKLIGAKKLAHVTIIKDDVVVHELDPDTKEVSLTWTDPKPTAGKTSYYYVRIQQADGNLAWASPMWITYKP